MNLKKLQRKPKSNKSIPIVDLVISDLLTRKEIGMQRYGVPLQAFNKRDALRDLYEELQDAVLYLKQVIVERKRHNASSKATKRIRKTTNKKY